MNLFRKKIIAFALVFSLFAVAGGFCYVSAASASMVSADGISQHEMANHKNMANHGNKSGSSAELCCVNNPGKVANNLDQSVKNIIKLSISAISAPDTFSGRLAFVGDKIKTSPISSPPEGDLLASVVKKE